MRVLVPARHHVMASREKGAAGPSARATMVGTGFLPLLSRARRHCWGDRFGDKSASPQLCLTQMGLLERVLR